MKQRDRQRRKSGILPPAAKVEPSQGQRGWQVLVLVLAAIVVVLGSYRLWTALSAGDMQSPIAQEDRSEPDEPAKPDPAPAQHSEEKNEPENFLDAFNEKDPKTEKEGQAALSNEELEKQFQVLTQVNEHLDALEKLAAVPGAREDKEEFERALALGDRLREQYNRQAAALEKAVALARKARPEDAVLRWLTAELLLLVGGEPEEIFPHLSYAVQSGLQRPRLLSHLAHIQWRANQFASALRTAREALDQDRRDRYCWNEFARAAISDNQFALVLQRLDQTFPAGLPDWAKAIKQDAADLQAKWEAEQKLRRAEASADDLPRVKLVIEHRRFAKDAAGNPLTTIENLGREEVILELYENEAPATVANFLDLVARGFYDGTSFQQAVAASMAAGGDPNTKNNDPSDDGAGGPGYVIPDEFTSPKARSHFRGSISMVNKGPHTTGSQFFLCLSPAPTMDAHFTVFGRILKGQDAVDHITQGRTTRRIGRYGKIIPGDLLVRAEVLRKRNHEYRVLKEAP